MSNTFNRLAVAASMEPGKGTALWKPRFDCFVIVSIDTLRQKVEYIHTNPVRKGLALSPDQWPYSSAALYAGKGDNDRLPVDVDWVCIGFDSLPSGKGS